MTSRHDLDRITRWRQSRVADGWRTIYATIRPEAAEALALLQAKGATAREAIEEALIAAARREP